MRKQLILAASLLLLIITFSMQPINAERSYVNISEAEAILDLMDSVATGQVTTREEIIDHLRIIYKTQGYQIMCKYHSLNPHENIVMNHIYNVCSKIINGQIEMIKGNELIYYDIYQKRDQYREFINRFKDWQPTDYALDRVYSYFPEKKAFEGVIYFVVDEQSDGYTPIPNMVFSIYQIKKMIDEKGVDFERELFSHELHHILTKELLLEKYQKQLLDSTNLSYFLGYIMLEGYAVEATADQKTKDEIYMMNRTDDEIYNLFIDIEKVIQLKGKNPDQNWRSIYREYFSKMIDIYTVGTTMVQSIEKTYGKFILVKALENPPYFFKLYQGVAENDDTLYKFDQSTIDLVIKAFSE